MERERKEFLLDEFGVSQYDYDSNDLLLAIMDRMVKIEQRVDDLVSEKA